jgi:hypothetical protein
MSVIIVMVMTMFAILPNEGAVFWTILTTFSPWAAAPRMRSFRFSAFSPVATAMVSGVTECRATTVMMVSVKLLNGGAVEQRRGVGGDVNEIV